MKLIISSGVKNKLSSKHGGITEEDILQCFANRLGKFLLDTREEHLTDPPSNWFVAETNFGTKLKVVFIQTKDRKIVIKTAYEANAEEIRIYSKFAC